MERMTTAEREAAEHIRRVNIARYDARVNRRPSPKRSEPSAVWLLVLMAGTFLLGGGVISLVYGQAFGVGLGTALLLFFLAGCLFGGWALYNAKVAGAGRPGRFTVSGVSRVTGDELATIIEASSAAHARGKGEQQGMIVAKVKRV